MRESLFDIVDIVCRYDPVNSQNVVSSMQIFGVNSAIMSKVIYYEISMQYVAVVTCFYYQLLKNKLMNKSYIIQVLDELSIDKRENINDRKRLAKNYYSKCHS